MGVSSFFTNSRKNFLNTEFNAIGLSAKRPFKAIRRLASKVIDFDTSNLDLSCIVLDIRRVRKSPLFSTPSLGANHFEFLDKS